MRGFRELRDRISWEPTLAEPEIPGLRQYGPAESVIGRRETKVTTLSEDRVSNVTFTLSPASEPHAGDRLDGAEVMEVTSIRDVSGRVLRWVAHAKQ